MSGLVVLINFYFRHLWQVKRIAVLLQRIDGGEGIKELPGFTAIFTGAGAFWAVGNLNLPEMVTRLFFGVPLFLFLDFLPHHTPYLPLINILI